MAALAMRSDIQLLQINTDATEKLHAGDLQMLGRVQKQAERPGMRRYALAAGLMVLHPMKGKPNALAQAVCEAYRQQQEWAWKGQPIVGAALFAGGEAQAFGCMEGIRCVYVDGLQPEVLAQLLSHLSAERIWLPASA